MNPVQTLYQHRELLVALAKKNIIVRYKQAYLGIAWAVLKPLMLMSIFIILRSFVGIDSGSIPYPVLTYSALVIWIFFQESASEGVISVVGNANLVRKIYFPREVFPLTAVLTKLVEFGINMLILTLLMIWYGITPGIEILWMPVLVSYTILISLTIAFAGAALNVHYRDISTALPVIISLMMYLSPVIYPLTLVEEKLITEKAAGSWSEMLFTLYTLNPLTGVIDGFQNVLLRGIPPNVSIILPGLLLTLLLLPISFVFFKRAEAWFADVI